MHKRFYPLILLGLTLLLVSCSGGVNNPNAALINEVVVNANATEIIDTPPADPEAEYFAAAKATTATLDELDIDEFFEAAYGLLLRRDPETVLDLGIEGYSVPDDALTDISAEHRKEMYFVHLELLDLLRGFDYDTLSESEQISYAVFEWYLEDLVSGYEYAPYTYSVTHFWLRSTPQLAIYFFTESHPLATPEDANAYVARLSALDDKIYGVIEMLEASAAQGVITPKFSLQQARTDINALIGYAPTSSAIYQRLREEIQGIEGLDEAAIEALLAKALTTLEEEVFPAFEALEKTLILLEPDAPKDISLAQFEGGAAYYDYILRHFTTSALSAQEVHDLGLQELSRIQAEMMVRFGELGYDTGLDLPTLYGEMSADAGTLSGNEIKLLYEQILADADAGLDAYFDLRPSAALAVIGGADGGYYSPGALDGSRPGQFYARTKGTEEIFKMYSLAYHEGIPGHHYQISIAQEADLPLFRNILIFDGYVEGWALYAEYLAAELGWYEENAFGDLGRLQYEALRACRMIADTGIHSQGWSYDQAVDFLVDNTGISRGYAQYEVARYIAFPGQAPAYKVGQMEILALREYAKEELGDDFDIREFHNVVLQNGSVPLEVLAVIVDNWVEGK